MNSVVHDHLSMTRSVREERQLLSVPANASAQQSRPTASTQVPPVAASPEIGLRVAQQYGHSINSTPATVQRGDGMATGLDLAGTALEAVGSGLFAPAEIYKGVTEGVENVRSNSKLNKVNGAAGLIGTAAKVPTVASTIGSYVPGFTTVSELGSAGLSSAIAMANNAYNAVPAMPKPIQAAGNKLYNALPSLENISNAADVIGGGTKAINGFSEGWSAGTSLQEIREIQKVNDPRIAKAASVLEAGLINKRWYGYAKVGTGTAEAASGALGPYAKGAVKASTQAYESNTVSGWFRDSAATMTKRTIGEGYVDSTEDIAQRKATHISKLLQSAEGIVKEAKRSDIDNIITLGRTAKAIGSGYEAFTDKLIRVASSLTGSSPTSKAKKNRIIPESFG